jgi:hypothetical protein
MPFYSLDVREVRFALWSLNLVPMSFPKTGKVRVRAMHVLRDKKGGLGSDVECTLVEHLVVECTEGHAVGDLVRAAVVVPLDVRSLQAKGSIAECKVEPTDGTLMRVGPQDVRTKIWIASALVSRNGKAQPDGVAEVGVERGLEVLIEDEANEIITQRPIFFEDRPD